MKTKFYFKILSLVLLCAFFSESAWASMRCGTHLITTGGRSNQMSFADVQRLCGSPYSKSGGTWIYYKGNQVYRLKFTDNGKLKEIYREMKR